MQRAPLPRYDQEAAYASHKRDVAAFYDAFRLAPPDVFTALDSKDDRIAREALYRCTVHVVFGKDMTTWRVGRNAARLFGTSRDIKIYTIAASHTFATTMCTLQTNSPALGSMNALPLFNQTSDEPQMVMAKLDPGPVEHSLRVFHHAVSANNSALRQQYPLMHEPTVQRNSQQMVEEFENGETRKYMLVSNHTPLHLAITFKMAQPRPRDEEGRQVGLTVGPYAVGNRGAYMVPVVPPEGVMGRDALMKSIMDDLKSQIVCMTPDKLEFTVAEIAQQARRPLAPAAGAMVVPASQPTSSTSSWVCAIEFEFIYSEVPVQREQAA